MRFGRYIVGLPSRDNDTLYNPTNRVQHRAAEAVAPADDNEDDNGAEHSEADAIV
ncbi:MAG: hypothetical protein M3Q07_22975 [Pseudobdellovibrionaceae bacterium]|nr:hypothetical protein [Pseudobdellovibrionaceae bacterium]